MTADKLKGRQQGQKAVRTTIVGPRLPGSGKSLGDIPRGIEVLVKKASVDAKFRELLIERRAEAAGEIGLELELAEVLMLNSVPRGQLEAIIANTRVGRKSKAAFLGRAAAVMLAALGTSTLGCRDGGGGGEVAGIRRDRPEDKKPAAEAQVDKEEQASEDEAVVRGIRPDRPKPDERAAEKAESEG